MFPPAPAITYTFPATFFTTSSTCDVNLGSSTLLLKPRLSGIRPPVGICCWAVRALTKQTANVTASTALFIIPLGQTNERLTFLNLNANINGTNACLPAHIRQLRSGSDLHTLVRLEQSPRLWLSEDPLGAGD